MSTNPLDRYKVTDETEVGPDVDLDSEHVTEASTGERVTEASADAFTTERAAEANRGGRPSLGSGRSPQVAFRIPAELREQAEEIASREGRTISAIAREQLERYVNSHHNAA
ncbi:hypothetical protein MUN78_06875 [Leucobacter allii]|uniref:Ribbon-helix-helix protein CopG domain-containing protein n=1 Tax=Leucobacter allii TaxID=2932247 RepID=A0ABY4FQT6_9MICO|nr:hypothetical protein [Leucobacter allii]UOQ58539.1 hypothetical protein MUN78_06875 [Leucobacter allii]